MKKAEPLKTLTISGSDMEQPVKIIINERSESALYALLGDFDRQTRPAADLFKVILLLEKLTASAYAFFQDTGKLPFYLTDEERQSVQTLLYVHDFFNFLEFAD